jgi:hypothetical protein
MTYVSLIFTSETASLREDRAPVADHVEFVGAHRPDEGEALLVRLERLGPEVREGL